MFYHVKLKLYIEELDLNSHLKTNKEHVSAQIVFYLLLDNYGLEALILGLTE